MFRTTMTIPEFQGPHQGEAGEDIGVPMAEIISLKVHSTFGPPKGGLFQAGPQVAGNGKKVHRSQHRPKPSIGMTWPFSRIFSS